MHIFLYFISLNTYINGEFVLIKRENSEIIVNFPFIIKIQDFSLHDCFYKLVLHVKLGLPLSGLCINDV